MIGEILAIGTELLMGQIVNSDAQYLSRRFNELGIDVYHHCVVGDNPKRLQEALALALSRSDLVVTTGGLGPTMDDLTKQTIAQMLDLPMVNDPASEQWLRDKFAAMGREITPNNLRQAEFPQGSQILKNRKGTAPGCIVSCGQGHIVVLPGPPYEMQDMFECEVVPWLQSRTGVTIHSQLLRIFGIGESMVEHQLRDLILAQSNPTIAPYAGTGEVALRITAKAETVQQAQALIAPVEQAIRQRLGDAVYATGDEAMEKCVAHKLLQNSKTLALAESCTGGTLAGMLTAIPGISAAFLEGAVTYSNAAKVRALGVDEALLNQHGAVSHQVAAAMAEGIRSRSGADYALSVTGIAGPDGGTQDKPVGLVYIGLADAQGTQVKELRLTGDRERIRRHSCLHALDLLRRRMG